MYHGYSSDFGKILPVWDRMQEKLSHNYTRVVLILSRVGLVTSILEYCIENLSCIQLLMFLRNVYKIFTRSSRLSTEIFLSGFVKFL